MKNAKIKATIIKSVSAVLCTLLISYAGITNTQKICDNNLEISANSSKGISSSDTVNDDFSASSDISSDDYSSADISSDTDEFSEDTDEPASENDEQNVSETQSGAESTTKKAEKKKITLTGGLSSTNKEEVLEYYKLVSKKNSKLLFTKTLTLVSMDGGKNMSQKMIDVFLPIAQKALDKNTVTDEPYPGVPDKIKASDWQEAKAVNDGTYTTVYIKVVPQTDSYNGKKFEGSAGRTMTVLDGLDEAISEMNVVSVDLANTKMVIKYLEPTVKLKVKNSTGELVKGGCEWKYITNPCIESIDAKVLAFNIHVEDAGGVVNYSVKY